MYPFHNGLSTIKKILVSSLIFFSSCTDSIEPDINEINVPTTKATGPGGPAFLIGNIRDYVHPEKYVKNIHIYLMNQQDYSDTILQLLVRSTDASFEISELPLIKIDIIFENDDYLTAKIGKLNLLSGRNSFYAPNSGGYFVDSTVYVTNLADSVGRPNAPPYGLQGYTKTYSVYFKSETDDSLSWELMKCSDCDTLRVFRYNDPIFDPYENDVYNMVCESTIFIKQQVRYYNWLKEVLAASPDYEVISN